MSSRRAGCDALSKPAVRFVRDRDVISWMRQPVALGTVAAAGPYTLTVKAVNGAFNVTPLKTNYAKGDTVTLTATPDSAYDFARWAGDVNDTTATLKNTGRAMDSLSDGGPIQVLGTILGTLF